ncbi:hypothetical protein Y1Q_0005067 [Alligator mississippiensis]|uniref:Reverse transcriptase domain-containing protein n=1 Tax=Alligator mississippiensis TaxID=8496 RepID=A0A151NBT4_ALLMI|nr:hypothetical protein Y1Q_0005067 [Alligator mississippiensis]
MRGASTLGPQSPGANKRYTPAGEGRGQSAAILNLDLEKAHKRVSHQFLFQTLEQIRVPPTFNTWIRTLYVDMSSEVQINSFLGAWIVVELGVQQGFPFSLILFVCTIKPLAQHLSLYSLDGTGPVTMSDHKKIQEMVRLRDIMSLMDLLPDDVCQAMRELIIQKDLHKDHRDLKWLIAH